MDKHFDAIIIGAGMSGLASGIRLAMYDQKVLILEKHTIAGGLNSYYQRKNSDLGGLRRFDVGLHALTNFAKQGERRKPLTKLLKQLRLPYEELKLQEQSQSEIVFPELTLTFSNDFELLRSEIHQKFPSQVDRFEKFMKDLLDFDEVNLNNPYQATREVLAQYFSDPLLIEMLLCPLLIYGSAWENDMDYSQFVIMFKSIYLEGFSRPEGGVRTIINLLIEKFKSVGGELVFNDGVESIVTEGNVVLGVETKKRGFIKAKRIFSSAGFPETMKLANSELARPAVGKMSFMESIIVTDQKIDPEKFSSTIVFYNNSNIYHYEQAKDFFDQRSAVFCCPDNYDLQNREGEGTFRITFMANYEQWKSLAKTEYVAKKEEVYEASLKLLKKLIPDFNQNIRFYDVFSPTTVERYTSHFSGTVYGSTDKTRDGSTPYQNLHIIGTDQGFLGIVGSMLSGISMANLYGLMGSEAP
jgi:phytoene dehydrogenase-like protein